MNAAGKLEVLPTEDRTAFEAANPVRADGTVDDDDTVNETRESVIVKTMLKSGPVSFIVLRTFSVIAPKKNWGLVRWGLAIVKTAVAENVPLHSEIIRNTTIKGEGHSFLYVANSGGGRALSALPRFVRTGSELRPTCSEHRRSYDCCAIKLLKKFAVAKLAANCGDVNIALRRDCTKVLISRVPQIGDLIR